MNQKFGTRCGCHLWIGNFGNSGICLEMDLIYQWDGGISTRCYEECDQGDGHVDDELTR